MFKTLQSHIMTYVLHLDIIKICNMMHYYRQNPHRQQYKSLGPAYGTLS